MYGRTRERLQSELDAIRDAGLYKAERVIETAQGATISVKGKKVLNF
nr:glycine C-acetyltransferase [Planctomycetota bacterium]